MLTTVADADVGAALVERLLDERLIACGNLVPGLTSIYRWQGERVREGEVLVVMKTVATRVEELLRRVAELHPYEVPELLALSAARVSDAYGRWVGQETIEVSA